MEDNPTNLGNGRQPQSFRQFKSLENGTELHFFLNERWPQFFPVKDDHIFLISAISLWLQVNLASTTGSELGTAQPPLVLGIFPHVLLVTLLPSTPEGIVVGF